MNLRESTLIFDDSNAPPFLRGFAQDLAGASQYDINDVLIS